MTITIRHDLSAAWEASVAAGRIANEFRADADDSRGRWKSGDAIRFGLCLVDGEPTYFARNQNTGNEIKARVLERQLGTAGYTVQLNEYRSLRPGASGLKAVGPQPDIPGDVSKCRFSCQNLSDPLSLLVRTPLAQVRLPNFAWNAYYNAAPFEARGHFMWVPVQVGPISTVIPHLRQQLTPEFLEDMLALWRSTEGMVIFFNSLHAGASVDHMHIQSVAQPGPLAVQRSLEAGPFPLRLTSYPARADVFDADSAIPALFAEVARCSDGGTPFNLLCIADQVYFFPRNRAHEIVAEFPSGVLGSMELSGKIIVLDSQTFESLTEDDILTALGKATAADDGLGIPKEEY